MRYIILITFILFYFSSLIYELNREKKQLIFPSNKTEIFQIEANPYDVRINIIITQDTAKALAYVKVHTDSSITIDDFRGAYAVTFTGYGDPSIWFPTLSRSIEDISYANHELIHILYYVTDRAGIKLDESTNEAFAYEMDYLTLQLFKNIK